jgi:protein TonB
MKRILFSGVIALCFHIAFFAVLPMFFQKPNKSPQPEVKSINVTMSYRPLKIKKADKIKPVKKIDQKKTIPAVKTEKKIEPEQKADAPDFSQPNDIEQEIFDNKVSNKESPSPQNTGLVNITEPFYKKKPLLKYPLKAKRRGYEGTVELMVQVSELGHVSNLWLFKSSNYKSLDNQAIKIVKKWIFEPGKRDGKPEIMWVKIPIKFKLE